MPKPKAVLRQISDDDCYNAFKPDSGKTRESKPLTVNGYDHDGVG